VAALYHQEFVASNAGLWFLPVFSSFLDSQAARIASLFSRQVCQIEQSRDHSNHHPLVQVQLEAALAQRPLTVEELQAIVLFPHV
jgi:hypothetical protein